MNMKEKQRRLMEVGRKGGLSTTIDAAKTRKMKTFKDKKGIEKAAVTKEDMQKAGFTSFGRESLRKYLMGIRPNKEIKKKTPIIKKKKKPIFDEPMAMSKKGGQISKAKKGGKVYNRKNGGDLMVASSYKGL